MDNKMKPLRWYLSGPISGYDMAERRKAFAEVEDFLSEDGDEVVNPLNNGLPEDAEWSDHILRDLELLLDCNCVCLMPGWKNSRGCLAEVKFARKMGIPVFGLSENVASEYELYCKENPVTSWKDYQ